MKNHLTQLLWVGLLSLLAMAQAQPSLRLGTTENQLLIAPVLEQVLTDAGFSVTTLVFPLARGHAELTEANIDGFFLMNDQVAQTLENTLIVPVAIVDTDYVAVSLAGEQIIASPADLVNYRVGIERGHAAQQFLAQGAKESHEAGNSVALMRMLQADRVDFMITNRPEVPRAALEAGIDNFVIQEPSLMTINLFLVLSSSQQQHLPAITAAFEQAKESGRLQQALDDLTVQHSN